MHIGPIEKCLAELKTPNILPGERGVIKGQVRNTLIDTSEEFLKFFLLYDSPLKMWVGTVRCQVQRLVVRGYLHIFSVGGILDRLKLRAHHYH